MHSERLLMLRVDELGQRCGVGFVTDVPRVMASEFRVRGSGTGLSHLRQPEVDPIREDRREQHCRVFDTGTGFEVGEVSREPGPLLNLDKQFSDFEVREHRLCPVDQHLRCVGNDSVMRAYFQAFVVDEDLG